MRKLQTKDIFMAARVIKKAGLKEELAPVMKLAAEGKIDVADVGINGIITLIETLSEKKAETALYDVLAGPFECTVQEVEEMEIEVLQENLINLAKENNLKFFFNSLLGLITTK